MKILITSGATREPIDKVRFITNLSTGRTGAALAEAFVNLKAEVTYLHGEGAKVPMAPVKEITFTTFNDLDSKVKKLLAEDNYDVVIHLAAVSDYSIDKVIQDGQEISGESTKLDSRGTLELKLKSNYKILNRIKSYSSSRIPYVVGFKLTFDEDEKTHAAAIERLFQEGEIDLVVHNDLNQISTQHPFHVYSRDKKLGTYSGAAALAEKLNSVIGEKFL